MARDERLTHAEADAVWVVIDMFLRTDDSDPGIPALRRAHRKLGRRVGRAGEPPTVHEPRGGRRG